MDRGATKTNYGSSYRASGHEKHKAHLINCTVVTLLLLVVDRWREDRMEVMAIELGCGAVHGRAACCSLQYERAKKIAADRKRGTRRRQDPLSAPTSHLSETRHCPINQCNAKQSTIDCAHVHARQNKSPPPSYSDYDRFLGAAV